jgi:hypothetical protein
MTVYRGYSDREDAVGGPENVVATVTNAGGIRPLPPLKDGFSWGYEGAGPRNLAAAILVDHLKLGPDYAGYLAEDAHFCLADGFMRAVVATWPQGGRWEQSESQITAWLQVPLAPCTVCRASYDVTRHLETRCPACAELDERNWTECCCGHPRGEHLGAWTADAPEACDTPGCPCQRFAAAA